MSVQRYGINSQGIFTSMNDGGYVSHQKFTELEQQLAESHRALRAETTAHDNLKMQLEKMAAENAGMKAAIVEHSQCFTVCKCCGTEHDCSHDDVCRAVSEVPETDSFLSELRAATIETCADDLVSKNDIGGYEIDAMYVYAENLRKGAQL